MCDQQRQLRMERSHMEPRPVSLAYRLQCVRHLFARRREGQLGCIPEPRMVDIRPAAFAVYIPRGGRNQYFTRMRNAICAYVRVREYMLCSADCEVCLITHLTNISMSKCAFSVTISLNLLHKN